MVANEILCPDCNKSAQIVPLCGCWDCTECFRSVIPCDACVKYTGWYEQDIELQVHIKETGTLIHRNNDIDKGLEWLSELMGIGSQIEVSWMDEDVINTDTLEKFYTWYGDKAYDKEMQALYIEHTWPY